MDRNGTQPTKPLKTPHFSAKQQIVSRAGHIVKAQIIASGTSLGRVARAAKISQPSLSNYIAGRRRDRETQIAIWAAWRGLSRQDVALEDFWGELLAS